MLTRFFKFIINLIYKLFKINKKEENIIKEEKPEIVDNPVDEDEVISSGSTNDDEEKNEHEDEPTPETHTEDETDVDKDGSNNEVKDDDDEKDEPIVISDTDCDGKKILANRQVDCKGGVVTFSIG